MSRQNSNNNLFLANPVTSTATSYTVLNTDYIILVTSTAAARTITLPAPSSSAATSNVGRIFIIKDTSGGAYTNNITLSVSGGANIDGVSTAVIGSDYGSITVMSNGTQYYIL